MDMVAGCGKGIKDERNEVDKGRKGLGTHVIRKQQIQSDLG
jgi:hypothetical protein